MGLGLAGLGLASLVAPSAAEVVERAEVHLRTAEIRVDPAAWVEPGRCLDLEPGDLRVRLRGREVPRERIVEIERERGPVLHAILLDTSRSMAGLLGRVREAAAEYARTVFTRGDRAFVLDFGSLVTLAAPRTAEPAAIEAALGELRIGRATALYDALLAAAGELDEPDARPVALLVTDGVDSASLGDQDDVLAAFEAIPRASVFVVGIGIQPIGARGTATPKKFLQRLAGRTGGRFFDVSTGSRVDDALRRIAEALGNRFTIAVLDGEPERPGRLEVETVVPGCEARSVPIEPIPVDRPGIDRRRDGSIPIPRPVAWRGAGVFPATWSSAAGCGEHGHVRREGDRVVGCVFDQTIDEGGLYSADEVAREWNNTWPEARLRPFGFDLSAPGALPTTPAEAIAHILPDVRALGGEVEPGPRQRPPAAHSRPFHDVGVLWNGRTWLEARGALAEAMAGRDDYREWVERRLEAEAAEALGRIRDRLGRAAPALAPGRLDALARETPAGRAILARAERPGPSDVRRMLGAWLGDVSAAELLAAWEARSITRGLAGSPDPEVAADYEALRRIFFVPSYARLLVPLAPGRDALLGRIGFWRVVLPRTERMLGRVRGGDRDDDELGDPPFDLVPPRPLAVEAFEEARALDPAAIERLGREGFVATSVRYEPLGPAYRRDPQRAFERVRVTIELGRGSERYSIVHEGGAASALAHEGR